jgi:hypothetical protein
VFLFTVPFRRSCGSIVDPRSKIGILVWLLEELQKSNQFMAPSAGEVDLYWLPFRRSKRKIRSIPYLPLSPSMVKPEIAWLRLYTSVAMTTLATLLLELSLTRIFSVVFMYHFAFLAISLAMVGLGAGGVFSYVVAGWRGGVYRNLGLLSILNSGLVMLALMVALLPLGLNPKFMLALVYFATLLPFFVAGTIVSLAISETIDQVSRVYFFDLFGAAVGCLLLIPLLNTFGGPGTLTFVAILFAGTGILWPGVEGRENGKSVQLAGAITAAVLICFLFFNNSHRILDVTFAKGQKLNDESFVKWNSFSRVAVRTDHLPRLWIQIDADASTEISYFNFDHLSEEDRRMLIYQGAGLPYALRPAAKTLIIGPGGGWDVARALASGSKDVTGAEINPIIAVAVMQDKFANLNNHLYTRPEVHMHVSEGRSFVRQSQEKYQVLQATLVDTWASTAAGAFALSENNLYTTDAFRDYLNHLTPDGIICFTRWGLSPPRESLRLVSLAMEALDQLGEADPAQHVIVGQGTSAGNSSPQDTVLISRKPFSAEDLNSARTAMQVAEMKTLYLPGETHGNPFTELLTAKNPAEYRRNYHYDISPVTDDRPFFFYSVQPRDLWAFLPFRRKLATPADYKLNQAIPMLLGLIGLTVMATLAILAMPPVILGSRLPRQKGILAFLTYFMCIGVGYILVEVILIQKFVLFLGHPTYALTVVVFAMLVSSALGSFASKSLLRGQDARLVALLGLVAVLITLTAFRVLPFLSTAVGVNLPAKIVFSVLFIFPVGFAMGMPFPTGLKRLERWHAPSLRWAWSLNAASSVLGSVGALVCAIYFGFFLTMLVGAAFYIAALVMIVITRPILRSSLKSNLV